MIKLRDKTGRSGAGAFTKRSMTAPWARLYYFWAHHTPPHPGKHRVLGTLHRIALRSDKRFVWRMRNGARLVLDPREGLVANETVSWQCFIERRWEPHVEQFMRGILKPGDTAIDVGANIGYFTTVMAQLVGPHGRVLGFEPVPEVRRSLLSARMLNGFHQIDVYDCALGSHDTELEMAVDPRLAGSSSLVLAPTAESQRLRVKVRTLDGLLAAGELNALSVKLLKIDVEGSELDVLEGARRLIGTARPIIVFELNARASRKAGWNLSDIQSLLQPIGGYRLHQLTDDGIAPYLDDGGTLGEEEFIDLVALAAPVTIR